VNDPATFASLGCLRGAQCLVRSVMKRTRRESLPGYEVGQTLGAWDVRRGVRGPSCCALARDVAIKQLWPDLLTDSDACRRFSAEARLLASLDHAHIVRVYDYVEDDVYALVLERMLGGTLRDRLRSGALAPQGVRLRAPPISPACCCSG
jgi:serine/threonine protein kinase